MKEFIEFLLSTWWGISIIIVVALLVLFLLSAVLYRQIFKRFYDVLLSLIALIILSPVLIILTILGAIMMQGNPFFTQLRPGKINKKTKQEKIFRLIKFRTMTSKKDKDGVLLPDELRLTGYGKFLRSTSLDELPELINILIGDMSIVGPRPLLVKYLPLYSSEQRERHLVKPGLTGYAQANGRNAISWQQKFELDRYYVKNISLFLDIAIIFKTVFAVLKKEGISASENATMQEFKGNESE